MKIQGFKKPGKAAACMGSLHICGFTLYKIKTDSNC
jgi:hypothetical protein